MANLRIENSDYIAYVLQRGNEAAIRMDKAPDGWDNDDLEIVRNKKYHGILTQFTDALTFRGREKDFINEAFALDGNNAQLYLIRYVLRAGHNYVIGDTVDTVKFRVQYKGLADFDTKKEKNGGLSLNFNSQELDKTIESYQSDKLSIGRTTDLENKRISQLFPSRVRIKGRELQGEGWAENTMNQYIQEQPVFYGPTWFTIPTEFGIKGFARHVEVTDVLYQGIDGLHVQSKLFYNDIQDSVRVTNRLIVKLSFRIKFRVGHWGQSTPTVRPVLKKYKFTGETYEFISDEWVGQPFYEDEWFSFDGVIGDFDYGDLTNENGLALAFVISELDLNPTFDTFIVNVEVEEFKIEVEETSKFDTNESYNFSFVNDVASRLTEIITGREKAFYSKSFARAELGRQDYKYNQDGEWGHIGLIHGFDLRRFRTNNELYKYMEVSMKSLMDSLTATFNIGVGVEHSEYGERLRFEKVNYFYQGRRAVKLPYQVTGVQRSIDAKMFNSSASFGSNKGGDYELALGLDEPNVRTDYILPLRRTSNKYTQLSDFRSDDTGMEIIRRQPEYLDGKKDTSGDEDIWYLDLKKNPDGVYDQLDWNDALAYAPEGIVSPDTYRSWRFTPKRSMFRHGSIIRGGMEQERNLQKYITLGSSKSNVNLRTRYLDNISPSEKRGVVSEKDAEKVFRLDNALMLPDLIKFIHPIDDDLMDWILGTTQVLVNGELEDVPNWYFKLEFTNEDGYQESGYLESIKPKTGEFNLYKANESLLGSTETSEEDFVFSTQAAFNHPITFKVGGTGFIRWNDGTPDTFYNGIEVEIEKYIDTPFNGTIDFYGSLTLLYVEDEGINFSHNISTLPEEMEEYKNYTVNTCDGDIKDLPRFIKVFEITGWNTIHGNSSDINAGIVILSVGGLNTLTGSISDAPNIENVGLWIVQGKNTISNYTAGVEFNSDILFFWHKPDTGNGLSSTEIDNILIDLYNSGMHRGSIVLDGSNSARTTASDIAVSGLQARGVQVNTN